LFEAFGRLARERREKRRAVVAVAAVAVRRRRQSVQIEEDIRRRREEARVSDGMGETVVGIIDVCGVVYERWVCGWMSRLSSTSAYVPFFRPLSQNWRIRCWRFQLFFLGGANIVSGLESEQVFAILSLDSIRQCS
jgi:hypothetical protein